jgi:hypothetical protein
MSEPSIYVSHTPEQAQAARRLISELVARGFVVAVNRFNVPVGKRVQPAVEQSMAGASRCLFCFSAKPGGLVEYEPDDLLLANERLRSLPAADWLIPVKLTPCELPAVNLGGSAANELAAVELHADWNFQFERLVAALPRTAKLDDSAQRAADPAPPGHASMETRIESMQGKDVDFTNAQGGAAGFATTKQEIGTLTADGHVSFVNVKR